MAETPDFEGTPLTRAEYIQSVIHLYRGEMQRSTVWRQRLDTTTNWAIVATVSILGFVFGGADQPYLLLILGNVVIFLLLWVEARRYRYYDIWRTRVRKIEENFFAPILRRELASPQERWGAVVADDFLNPTYKIPFAFALKMRLRRNYIALFSVTLVAWAIKVYITAGAAAAEAGRAVTIFDLYAATSFTTIPPWVLLTANLGFYLAMIAILVLVPNPAGYGGEIHEVTGERAFWDR